MTTMQPRELWSTMPGWGIVANLIPPEVTQSRRVRAIRKLVLLSLCVLLLLAGIGYGVAFYKHHEAAQSLAAEQTRTSQLLLEQNRYAAVTQIQGSIGEVRIQLADLLGSDVDMSALMTSIVTQLPSGASFSQVSVNIAVPSAAQAAAAPSAGVAALDTSGDPQIGTITLTGQAAHVQDVAVLVNRLSTVKGLVGAYPTSNSVTEKGAQFTIQVSVNNNLLSHRFDTTTTAATDGGK